MALLWEDVEAYVAMTSTNGAEEVLKQDTRGRVRVSRERVRRCSMSLSEVG
jgi:hypothetical protein